MNSRSSGFTLLELMIIVAILLDVAVIALPSFIRSRNMVQNTKFINDLRTATSAFEMYATERTRAPFYPPNVTQGVMPSGMAVYLSGMEWTRATPIGGRWDWEPSASSPARLGVRYISPAVGDDLRMIDIDRRTDNGVLTTGSFRRIDSRTYLHIIE